jgi:hypothetical protein
MQAEMPRGGFFTTRGDTAIAIRCGICTGRACSTGTRFRIARFAFGTLAWRERDFAGDAVPSGPGRLFPSPDPVSVSNSANSGGRLFGAVSLCNRMCQRMVSFSPYATAASGEKIRADDQQCGKTLCCKALDVRVHAEPCP